MNNYEVSKFIFILYLKTIDFLVTIIKSLEMLKKKRLKNYKNEI